MLWDSISDFNCPATKNPPSMRVQGEVYVQTLNRDDCVFNAPLFCIRFTPKSYTHWCRCSGGVIILVLKGNARLGLRQSPLKDFHAGDLIRISPQQEHFIVAGQAGCTVLAILTNLPNNCVSFGQEVDLQSFTSPPDVD